MQVDYDEEKQAFLQWFSAHRRGANIASYYENKTGKLLFTDAEDLHYSFEFPVSHTFEKPVEPASILSNGSG